MAAYDDQYAAEPLSFSGVPFFESAVEAPGKRTFLQMGLQMEISVSLTQVQMCFSDIPQDIIWLLWRSKGEFDSMKSEAKFLQGKVSRRRKRKRGEDKTPW